MQNQQLVKSMLNTVFSGTIVLNPCKIHAGFPLQVRIASAHSAEPSQRISPFSPAIVSPKISWYHRRQETVPPAERLLSQEGVYDKMSQIIQRNLHQTRKETITVSADKQIRFDAAVDHGSFSPSHWHEAIEIIYVLEGTAVVTLFDQTVTLGPGQLLLINSGLVHASRCPSGNRTILVQIPDKFLSACLSDISRLWFSVDDNCTDPGVQRDVQHLKDLLLDMMHLQESARPGYLFSFNKDLFEFLELLYQKFLREMPGNYQPKSTRVLSRLDAVLDYTHQNYSSQITLRNAAGVAALQPEYFCRFFRENMGTTYLQYLNDYRLSRLYRVLLVTDLSIRELEERHGFSNDKLFHKLFRERFHTTPLQARKTARRLERSEKDSSAT